ncbi:heme exporter protein CcmB [Erwinia sp. OLTSP20]|uniref:heme exporter protein CcmB n=1 Tax=unclassified Erwinia TaxID=2622719 RepID=UPI000C1A251D|nr:MULTISPECIES: heme exporter protein CcmB [unclassified Erwinia]PIJ51605.1 heme exporter protein CcmB [Erwinia sp. OAMSP11]PIJ75908.1 heme exporter protein CcmB [Erwinia sp. OLSSP12]PIJ83516.1 heme exporter protein CcmB [Erwinia sp. OLCASP19]PIJ86349.1 heme exporter protein CcmB [Erwinia sp. OLMTSP26]PIJ88531.1 heme exporter protein CcmB [Erwinia sp. OLMDSP33]
MFWRIIQRELRTAFRSGAEIMNPLWFFLIVITLFPLGIGPQPALLAAIAPGIVWVAALLASLLASERLFRDDFADGSLEQLLLLPLPLPVTVLGKVTAHWIITGLPLIVLSPLAALLLSLDFNRWCVLALTLLLGTPTLSLLAAIGVALTVGLRRGGVLLSLLTLPLAVPLLIFASAAMDAAATGLPLTGYLAILGAFLLASAVLSPFATAAALRISLD